MFGVGHATAKPRLSVWDASHTTPNTHACQISNATASRISSPVVFKEKSVGTAFYMILKGSVSIEVMNADEEIGIETVATIGVGRSFGERAIESASSLREVCSMCSSE